MVSLAPARIFLIHLEDLSLRLETTGTAFICVRSDEETDLQHNLFNSGHDLDLRLNFNVRPSRSTLYMVLSLYVN